MSNSIDKMKERGGGEAAQGGPSSLYMGGKRRGAEGGRSALVYAGWARQNSKVTLLDPFGQTLVHSPDHLNFAIGHIRAIPSGFLASTATILFDPWVLQPRSAISWHRLASGAALNLPLLPSGGICAAEIS